MGQVVTGKFSLVVVLSWGYGSYITYYRGVSDNDFINVSGPCAELLYFLLAGLCHLLWIY
jgi:hypothetical protein